MTTQQTAVTDSPADNVHHYCQHMTKFLPLVLHLRERHTGLAELKQCKVIPSYLMKQTKLMLVCIGIRRGGEGRGGEGGYLHTMPQRTAVL